MDPISIGMFLFKGTFDLMYMIMRKKTLEKLRECGDVTDQNVRTMMLKEIDKVSFKLDCQSRKSLKLSKSYYKDGLGFLNNLINADSDESSKPENLQKAQEAFKEASNKAREACLDESLGVAERLEAVFIRIMATIQESVENPSGILIPCGNCLDEMQDIPKIKGIFDAVIRKRKTSEQDIKIFVGVCQLYRVLHDFTQSSNQCSGPWTWPCIRIKGKKMSHKIDPLRDVRVAEALCQLQREKGETMLTSIASLPVVWSFGSEGDGKLISPRYITTNPEGQFIIMDNGDRTIKVFDESGKFMKFNSFRPLCSHLADEDILSVVTDREGNLYVLIKIDKYRYEVHVFKKHVKSSHKFPQSMGLVRCSPTVSRTRTREEHLFKKHVQFSHKFPLREGLVRCSPIINDNNEVLVVIEQKDQNIHTVDVYSSDGELVENVEKEILKEAKDMTIVNEGRLMVLDGLRHVVVFDAERNHMPELDFDHEGVPPEAIAFHSETKHVVVSNLEPRVRVKMSIYNENRNCVLSIYQGEERNVKEETECVPPKITVTKDGRLAILAGIVGESKVIVV